MRSTTVLCVRRNGKLVVAGDAGSRADACAPFSPRRAWTSDSALSAQNGAPPCDILDTSNGCALTV
jgi:hypothetical protein